MKLLRISTLGLALAAGFLASGAASAATICSGCAYITGAAATNLGSHDPTASPVGDASTFVHNAIPTGGFSDWWVFQINPAGDTSINAIFLPQAAVSGFKVELYSTTGTMCTAPSGSGFTIGGSCTSYGTLGSLLGSTPVGGGSFELPPLTLSAGYYVFNIMGTAADTGTRAKSYTGQLNTSATVPEPGSLALVALGLLGAGVSLRRSKKA